MPLLSVAMDTRAYRCQWPRATTLFELDRPALLEMKDALLATTGARSGCVVRPVGVDLLADWTTPVVEAGFRGDVATVWLVEGLFYFLTAEERDTLIKELTALSAPGSWLLGDYVSQTFLDSAAMSAWRGKMAADGHAWKSGCDDPVALLGGQGWAARVVAYGEPGADFGRWTTAVETGVPATRGRYLITATVETRQCSAM